MTTIVFALPLGYFLTNQVIHRREVFGAAIVVLGLAIFTVVGDEPAGTTTHPRASGPSPSQRSGVARRLFVLGGRGTLDRKAALYGVCAGVLFGLSASLCKPTMEIFGDSGVGRC